MRLFVIALALSGCGTSLVTEGQPSIDGGAPACTVTPDAVTCTAVISHLTVGTANRDVYWQTPVTPPPANGYPVVVLFQGSFLGPSTTWGTVSKDMAFGGYQQARLQAMLLAQGYVVIAPSAASGVAWQTNTGGPWDLTADSAVMTALFEAMARGDFTALDASRWYATGISSGGYMTSRMALSYAGKFRALAIESASWATCAGSLCAMPATLPADHPPTLFLHGRKDTIVPLSTAEDYFHKLQAGGFTAELEIDDNAGHEWLAVSPERITTWFESH